MTLIEVTNAQHAEAFYKLPFKIYSDDPNWIAPLRKDINRVFDKKKNKYFRHGSLVRFLLLDDRGETIGRVAAFINEKKAKTYKQPTGALGFFECIENKEAAFMLFDACKAWLSERGMEAMDGPINFGENDQFWGLITKNFEAPPYYRQNYNPPYYVDFFEEYGFQVYYNQLIYYRDYHMKLQDRFMEKAERVLNNPDYSFEKINKKQLYKYAEDFRTVYNRAWMTHDNFKGMSSAQARSIMNNLKPILDENLVHFAYYKSEPVGFYVGIPELNQVFRHLNGRLDWWGKIKFFWYKEILKVVDTSFALAFGVDPDHQHKGMEGALFAHYEKAIRPYPKRYKDLIITWIGDFNPKMIRIIENLGAELFREMATYRKLFDENAEFERAPIIE